MAQFTRTLLMAPCLPLWTVIKGLIQLGKL